MTKKFDIEALPVPITYSRLMARAMRLPERQLPLLLEGTGLSADILLPGSNSYISVKQHMIITANACRQANDPLFGLKFGHHMNTSSHGPLGYLALSSPDLITALQSFFEYLPVRIPFARVEITSDSEWLFCSLEFLINIEPTEKRVFQECFALIMQSIVESVIGSKLETAVIKLAHSKPAHSTDYADYIHSDVSFDSDINVFMIPIAFAETQNAVGDPNSYRFTQNLCKELLSRIPQASASTVDQVKSFLLSHPPGSVSEDDIANALFISSRTLARRLCEHGTSFKKISESIYSELAIKQLSEQNVSIESIALTLGYYDAASFRKAFKRWHGVTPSEYRDTRLSRVSNMH
ncbi:AraC family transcriptional regulator ligand-binding domain-containing protein [Alcanivorax sp.]|jgi:AraC-like DNA-binding protein|uniref:AraC family transcriptional regulator n=1 Tax=Alcanivorax sp. TaxID=1872427 RepID=UPI0032D8DA23